MSEYQEDLDAHVMKTDDGGEVLIGDNVIGRIVEIATREFAGQIALRSKFNLSNLINRKEKDNSSSIHIERDPDNGTVDITVDVRIVFGEDFYDLAIKLRNHIKHTVENMTRVDVKCVNVKIVDTFFPERAEDEDEPDNVNDILSANEAADD